MANKARGLVLGYHDIVFPTIPRSGFQNPEAGRYKFSEAMFRRHVAVLADARDVCPSTVRRADDVPGRGVLHALTFDDGGASAALIADTLEERGLKGHFFVVTGMIGSVGFLTAEGIRDLDLRGHVVGSHSQTHPSLMARMDPSAVRDEWARSRDVLEQILGTPVKTASVPGGSTSRMVEDAAASCGIEVLFTSEPKAGIHDRGGCLVVGRYQLYGADTAETALAIARGARGPRLSRAASWKSRRLAERVLGKRYLRIRKTLLD